jgi:CheY-like chemotaxis protein
MIKMFYKIVRGLNKVNQTNILVIDHVEAIRNFLSLVLKRMGDEFIETADSPEEAIENFKMVFLI